MQRMLLAVAIGGVMLIGPAAAAAADIPLELKGFRE